MAKREISIEKLPSNDRDPTSRLEPIKREGRVRKKKGGGVSTEIRTIGNTLFSQNIMPAITDMIFDFFISGLAMMLGKDTPKTRAARGTSYHKPYARPKTYGRRASVRRAKPIENPMFDDIYFEHRHDAEGVLGRMMERVAEYGWASVGDLNSLAGLNADIVAEDWGWEDLHGTRVVYTTDGFIINFPNPIPRR